MFYVGQKVVCVCDDPFVVDVPGVRYDDSMDGLRRGIVYTIRRTGFDKFHSIPVVWLHEIKRTGDVDYAEAPFWAGRFRPVIERKTDISVFTAMLTPSRINEPVG